MKSVRQTNDEQSLPKYGRGSAEGDINFFDLAIEWQRELLHFAVLRMGRYIEHTSQFLRCRTPSDIAKTQTSFIQKALSDYGSITGLFSIRLSPEKLLSGDMTASTMHSYERSLLQAQRDASKIIDLAKEQAAHIVEEATGRSEKTSASSRRRSGANRAKAG
jgi:hypothetical protein